MIEIMPSTSEPQTENKLNTNKRKRKAPEPYQPVTGECSICMDSYDNDYGVLNCKHIFCFNCIQEWSKRENTCPLCKARFSSILRFQLTDECRAKNTKPKGKRVKVQKKPSPRTGSSTDRQMFGLLLRDLFQNHNHSFLSDDEDDEDYDPRNEDLEFGNFFRTLSGSFLDFEANHDDGDGDEMHPPFFNHNNRFNHNFGHFYHPPTNIYQSHPHISSFGARSSENNLINLIDDGDVIDNIPVRTGRMTTSNRSNSARTIIDLTDDQNFRPITSSSSSQPSQVIELLDSSSSLPNSSSSLPAPNQHNISSQRLDDLDTFDVFNGYNLSRDNNNT